MVMASGKVVAMDAELVIESLKYAAKKLAEDAATLKRSHQIAGSTDWDCDEARQEFFDNSRHSFRLFQIVRQMREQMHDATCEFAVK